MSFLQREIDQRIEARMADREPERDLLRGLIIAISGDVQDALNPQVVWVRGIDENGSIRKLLNDGVIAQPQVNMLVWYERNPKAPAAWALLKFDASFYLADLATFETLPTTGTPAHGLDHYYPPGRPGKDPVWINSHQLFDLAVTPTVPTSMRVQIWPGWYPGDEGDWVHWDGPQVTEDMTAQIPSTSGMAVIRAIALSPDGTLNYYNGAEFADGTELPADAWPGVPTASILLHAVRLVNGMTTIEESNFEPGMRGAGVAGGGSAGAPVNASYLTLATDTELTDERVFTPGEGLVDTDNGAGSTYVLDAKVNRVYRPDLSGAVITTDNFDFAYFAGSISIDEYLFRTGDPDTYAQFTGSDQIDFLAGGVHGLRVAATEVVVNEGSAVLDFRVESDINANALLVKGSDGKVGIGTNAPAAHRLHAAEIDTAATSGTLVAMDYTWQPSSPSASQFPTNLALTTNYDSSSSPSGGFISALRSFLSIAGAGVQNIRNLDLLTRNLGAGTVADARTIHVRAPTGNFTSHAALYIEDATAPTVSYGIYQLGTGMINLMQGLVTIGASATASTGTQLQVVSNAVSGAGVKYVALSAVSNVARTIIASGVNWFRAEVVGIHSGGTTSSGTMVHGSTIVFSGNAWTISLASGVVSIVRTSGTGTANLSILIVYL
jgi:hypothetical protein